MCGRYAASRDPAVIVAEFEVQEGPERILPADYNVAPTKDIYVIRDRAESDGTRFTREMLIARWGLIPTWAKDPSIGARMNNARMETAAEKPAFRQAYAKRRCLIPAEGYYEWYTSEQLNAKGKPVKQPFFIHSADGSSLAIAGLLEWWRDRAAGDEAPWQLTAAVLTTEAIPQLATIHDRMPVMVPRPLWSRWLDPTWNGAGAIGLLGVVAEGELVAEPVSMAVNNSRNNGPELLIPVPAGMN